MKKGDVNRALSEIAEPYVRLVLAVGQHDSNYVDAYYGPATWKSQAEHEKVPLDALANRAAELLQRVDATNVSGAEEMLRLRAQYLRKQLQSLQAHVRQLQGQTMRFDEESAALYDAVAPHHAKEHFEAILREMDPLLPGSGNLTARYETFQKRFAIPKDKLAPVFQRAIAEARQRTLRHISLPAQESFVVEYVNGKVWSAYNWYKGDSHSIIQVNTDLPVDIAYSIHLACHEGYSGHHVYNALLEDRLVKQRGWQEFTVYPLYSPQSLIAEGTAEYGVDVAMPPAERLAFTRDVLFPMAGLDAKEAGHHDQVRRLFGKLNYAGNEAARQYLDGAIKKEEAISWLMNYGLMTRARAEQRLRFIEQLRAYVINYNLGQDLVRGYLTKRGAGQNRDRQWKELESLLSSPRLPSGLRS